MSTTLRWFVLVSSTVLALLAAPDCWRVVAEEIGQPLAERGSPLVVHGGDRAVAADLLAMRAPAVAPRLPAGPAGERER